MDVIKGLSGFVGENLGLLADADKAWQPTDFLPDLSAGDWAERVAGFRESSAMLSDDVLVVLVGNMVTEEALPNYAISLNQIVKDSTGTGDAPWNRWLRGWTAEENRHGDLLNAYLRLTGRVDMRSIEQTIHHLIKNGFNPIRGGFDPHSESDAYAGLMYASFQERATRISHTNVAKLAASQGDDALSRICRRIAGDESRHESFYTKVVGQVMEQDPEGGLLAFRSLLRGVITMPGQNMADGRTPDLYDQFAAVSQRLGAYTVHDYARIIGHLTKTWRIADLSVSGKAARAQDYLCQQAARYELHADEIAANLTRQPAAEFAWLRRPTLGPIGGSRGRGASAA
ncbi:acyl-ACP desaturase [Tundrisphaera sp. TA3]|uniref:acyl-ACP desaturase n=1 Tax=Tundrisphaera sp. TA3 TaxID=3435775 RepID=UPI003EBB63FB